MFILLSISILFEFIIISALCMITFAVMIGIAFAVALVLIKAMEKLLGIWWD